MSNILKFKLIIAFFHRKLTDLLKTFRHMSCLMTKPTKWLCTQRRLRSAWASADLSLCWAHMPFCWFCHAVAYIKIILNFWRLQCETPFLRINWTASSEFGTYRLCKQRRFRRACASAQSRQNLHYSLIQAVSQEEPSHRKPDPWPLWMAGHAQLKFVMTECSKTQIRLMGLI